MAPTGVSDHLIARLRARHSARPDVAMGGRTPARPLPAPTPMADVLRAEAYLGFRLPLGLRRLYLELADGGFGPGSGLLSIRELVREYRDLTSSPVGPRGQAWPVELLPVAHHAPGYDCLDLTTGAMIAFDPGALIEGDSDRHWWLTFKPGAASLGAHFDAWVGRPTPEEEREALIASMLAELESGVYPQFR